VAEGRAAAASGPCRILDLRDSPWVDGPGRTILDTAAAIDPRRYAIAIGTFVAGDPGEHRYLQEALRRGLATHPIAEQRALDVGVLRQIERWCREQSVRMLHTHDFRSDLYGLIAARRLGIPAVATCHGWIANSLKGHMYVRIDKRLLRRFDRVIVVSERMRGQLRAAGVDETRIAVIPNALVVGNYQPRRGDPAVRLEWSVSPSAKLVANIGRLSPEKGQAPFLRAAAVLAQERPDAHFALVGIGPDEASLRRLAGELGIADRVIFAGYRSDMQAVYDSVDLVVQSSSTEGMPNVILEALLMRVPVVATDVGGTAEIVEDGRSGRLVRSGELQGLVRAMREALDDPARAQAWADQGEKRVRAEFDHTERLRRITRVYDDVAKLRSA
jgi:glycosyltransferase involved in cell wall biosynthesis